MPMSEIVDKPLRTAAAAESAARVYDDEEDVCRICRSTGDVDNPLRYPCACSGSIKFVHQDCLLQWLNHSNARQCEVCKHPFAFSPVYAENAPSRLPFREFVLGVGKKTCRVLKFFLRLSVVLSVWLLIIPFISFWIWRLAFVRGFSEANRLFLSHMSLTLILTDCLHGFLLSATIVFIFLGVTSLRDYFRHLRELGGQHAERDDERDRNGARAVRRPVVQVNRNLLGDFNVAQVGEAQGVGGDGQMIRRNAENVAAQWERQGAHLEAHVDQMFDGLDDPDGAEDVPFNELVGMQGPVFHLLENAFTVLASNMVFLGVVIFVPFSLGRLILHFLSWLVESATNPVLSTSMPFTETALSLSNITLKNALSAANNLTLDNPENILIDHVGEMMGLNASAPNLSPDKSLLQSKILEGMTTQPSRLSDVTTLVVGYMLIVSLVYLYFGINALVKYARGEPLTMGRFQGIVSILEAVTSLCRQFLACVRHFMTMIKVTFLMVVELGYLPLMCGWWLDVCTVRMFGKSMADRVLFFSVSPFASSLVHWVVGILYMLQIGIFVSLLRGILRNGVLYFLRDPADPNYNPYRDLINDPVHKHARRVLLSVGVYGSLIVMLVFLPVKLAMRMTPSIFPLDISVADPFTEIPADILLFQICIPFAIEHFKLKTTIKCLLRCWFTYVGQALGLTDYLFPQPEDSIAQDNANANAGRQDKLHSEHLDGVAQPNRGQLVLPHGARGSENSCVADENDGEEQSDPKRYGFAFRIVILLVVAWMTLLVFNSALVVIPVYLGRLIFNSIPLLPIRHGINCNDLYAFTIGSYLIWTAIAGLRYTVEQIKSGRAAVLLGQIWKWGSIFLKSSALLSIWIFVIPVLIGLLFELLVLVPMRVAVNKSPVFLLYQDWALGLVFLKVWTKLVMFNFPLVDESWRTKFRRVRENGFSRLEGLWILREIVLPIIMKLLTALCVPYILARGVIPVFGYPLIVNSAVYRFAWLGCLCLGVLFFCVKRFHIWFTNLHNSIRDDRYLIGRVLHNFGEMSVVRVAEESGSSNVGRDVGIREDVDVGLRLRRGR